MNKYKIIMILLIGVIGIVIVQKTFFKNENGEYIKIFYPDNNVEVWLIKEEKIENSIESIFNYLIKDNDLLIPDNLVLNNFSINESILTIDISEHIIFDPNTGIHSGDKVVFINLSSIVNTYCLNETLNIDEVIFLINGVKVDTIGAISNKTPFKPNATLSYY